MNRTTRKTRACTFEALDEKLREAIRSHATEYGLQDLETNVLMCCETLSAWQQKGFHGGIRTTLSVVYVTPRWLVWVDGSHACTAQLKHIDVSNFPSTDYSISPNQGLHVSGRYTRENSTATQFIVLDSEAEGQKFRSVLQEALLASRRSGQFSQKASPHRVSMEGDNSFFGK